MKIAIDTFSYYMHFGKHWYVPKSPVDIKWYCYKSKELGADGLHIDPYHINLETEAGWVRDFAKKNRMYVELGACGTSIKELKLSIEAAELLGAKAESNISSTPSGRGVSKTSSADKSET